MADAGDGGAEAGKRGSSVLFGIDAGMVQDALHMRAENFGLHAGMRLDWLLAEGEQTARSLSEY
jgi:hypothetical protein